MHNMFAESLARLVESYYQQQKVGGAECRLVVPGLTERVSEDLHARLRSMHLPSYLVVPEDQGPDSASQRMHADGLTSFRLGSMIAVVYPGELTRIQDSIIGSGGAVRSTAFSDEWPWVSEGNAHFDFNGVIEEYVELLGASGDEARWIVECVGALVRATRGTLDRGHLVLDRVLASFDPSAHPQLTSLAEKFAYHVGLIRPPGEELNLPDSAKATLERISRLGGDVLTVLASPSCRQDCIDRIAAKHPDHEPERRRLEHLLHSVMDAYASQNAQPVALLALRGCWPDANAWAEFDEGRVREVFGIGQDEKLHLEAALVEIDGPVSADQHSAVVTQNGAINLRVAVPDLPNDGSIYEVLVVCQRATVASFKVSDQEPKTVQVDWGQVFPRSLLKNALTVRLLRDGVEKAAAKLLLHTLRDKNPAALVLDPGFQVVHFWAGDMDPTSMDTASALSLRVARLRADLKVGISFNGVEQSTVATDSELVLACASPIEPFETGTGEVEVQATCLGDVGALLIVRALTGDRGTSNVETELVTRMSVGNVGRVKALLKVFSGTAYDYYPGLATPDDAKRRWQIAAAWEARSSTGQPVLANLSAVPQTCDLHRTGELFLESGLEAPALAAVSLGGMLKELVESYSNCRRAIINAVQEQRQHDSRWPDYALWPVFLEVRRDDLDAMLRAYLSAYMRLRQYVADNLERLSWDEAFCLLARDTVSHWANDDLRGQITLLGPWHPLVVSKRFLVQGALVPAAKRFVNVKNDYAFNRLAVLLDQVDALRWIPMLDRDGVRFAHGYTSATSDPGWLLVVEGSLIGHAAMGDILTSLRRGWGVEATLLPVSRDQLASGFVRDYLTAHPQQRSVSLSVPPIYSPQRVVESCAALLEQEGAPTLCGHQLPGGIHVFFSSTEQSGYEVPSTSPAVRTYVSILGAKQPEWRNITLLPPPTVGQPKTSSSGRWQARGAGMAAGFTIPARSVGVGAGAPISMVCEWERHPIGDAQNVGAAFHAAIANGQDLLRVPHALSWSFHLPHVLKDGWHVLPGTQIDPAALISYVRQGTRFGEARTLWDYSMSLYGASNSYFVLTSAPTSIKAALNGSAVLDGKDIANELISDLASIGIAIGGESLRSGTNALGVLGVVGAVRLFCNEDGASVIRNEGHMRGFLLPADSFKDILGPGIELAGSEQAKRTDLFAIQLREELGGSRLGISFASVECKYSSGRFKSEDVPHAHDQARQAFNRLLGLTRLAATPEGIPARLALALIVAFGLRLTSHRATDDDQDVRIVSQILSGLFKFEPPQANTVVVSTSCAPDDAELLKDGNGWWAALATGSWPGINESSPSLRVARRLLGQLFSPLDGAHSSEAKTATLVPEGSQGVDPPSSGGTTPQNVGAVAPEYGEGPSPQPSAKGSSQGQPSSISRSEAMPAAVPLLLGVDRQGAGVYYDPVKASPRLDNYNVMITGSSGKGKTQLIKGFVKEVRAQGMNVFMLDFKNDFAGDQVFLQRCALSARYVAFDGLPYNPLIPTPLVHPATGEKSLQCSQHITGLVSVLGATFGLGVQQQNSLKEAIREAYREYGIDPSSQRPYTTGIEFPDFNDVGARLRALSATAYSRLDPLFDLGIFSSATKLLPFSVLLARPMVLDLSQIQSDPIKNSIARILILSAHSYYNSQSHSALRQYLVFDEAHRMLDSADLTKFVRECRAYGVGVVLSSQYPSDFPPEVSASLNTKIIHGNDRDQERVKSIVRLLGPTADEAEVARLGMFEAYGMNAHHAPTFMRTFAYPHQIAYDFLAAQPSGVLADDVSRVEGLTPSMAGHVLEQLKMMGLAQEVNGRWVPARVFGARTR